MFTSRHRFPPKGTGEVPWPPCGASPCAHKSDERTPAEADALCFWPRKNLEHSDRASGRRCTVTTSARSSSEPLTSSTPRASSCRTRASNWSDASASRRVNYLGPISSPNVRIEARLTVETPHGPFEQRYRANWEKVGQAAMSPDPK